MRAATRRPVLALVSLAMPGMAAADILLSSSEPIVRPHVPVVIHVTVTNPGSAPQTTELPKQLPAQVTMDTKTRQITLHRVGDGEDVLQVTLAPGEFHRQDYVGELPRGFLGAIVLTASGMQSGPLLLEVRQSPSTEPPPLAVSVYEPVYFIAGGDGGLNAKFQISFRYQLFDSRSSLVRSLPVLDNLYIGYSQTSLWDLQQLSSPFRDSSYRPRLFYADYDIGGSHDGLWHFGVEAGIGHESNGKSGADSRSLNMFYAKPMLMLGDPLGRRFYVAPLISTYVWTEQRDIYRHRGYVDLAIGFGSKSSWNFWTTLRQGTDHFGSAELNLSYPLSRSGGTSLSGWVLLQYFSGYGESLVDYDRKLRSQLRLGLAVAL